MLIPHLPHARHISLRHRWKKDNKTRKGNFYPGLCTVLSNVWESEAFQRLCSGKTPTPRLTRQSITITPCLESDTQIYAYSVHCESATKRAHMKRYYSRTQHWFTHARNYFPASTGTERGTFPDPRYWKSGLGPWPQDRATAAAHYQASTGHQLCLMNALYTHHFLHESCKIHVLTTSQMGWGHLSQEKKQRWMPSLSLTGTEGRSRKSICYNSHYKWTL